MKDLFMLSNICRCLSQLFKKLVNFVTMRRVFSGIVHRVLLSQRLSPAMEPEAWVHTDTRRKLVVGLGNPGLDGTRHNVGRAVLNSLAVRLGLSDRWKGDRQLSSEVIVSEVDRVRVILLKPKLLMNVNGAAVAKAVSKFGVKAEDVLLVHDEIDKPLGKIAVKLGGSARGHNGVRSCVDCLNTDVMRRLRVGIGRPAGKTSVERHVLGRFSSEEKKVLDSVLVQSVDQLLTLLSQTEPEQSSQSPPGGAADKQQQQQQQTQDRDTAASRT